MAESASHIPPTARRLRVYAFDPSLATRLSTVSINELAIGVRWEAEPGGTRSSLKPGPIGEYIEVVDVDPASGRAYTPVDLDDPVLLAQDGLPPDEGNPQFHQQMVYAVAMATIEQFERALGRVALWASHRVLPKGSRYGRTRRFYVPRLRLYPHALRAQNAYYSPDKKAILFGYFPSRTRSAYSTRGLTVYSCLAHDIIAHEVTHALLDGIHPRFSEGTNPDVLAFHEGFADIVAMFQRFTYPGVLRDQIARTRGGLDSENLLAQLAQQFGEATAGHGALRDALGGFDAENGGWKRAKPDPARLDGTLEPHDRGAVLVAAVFGAFLAVYHRRAADLMRIATNGTGTLPEGQLHPDLVARLAEEAALAGRGVLTMCIRALDYCPPVDITFGDYLRAIVTADLEINPDDPWRFRVAMIESFRAWGIMPTDVRGMSEASLQFPTVDVAAVVAAPEAAAAPATPTRKDVSSLFRGSYSEEAETDDEAAAPAPVQPLRFEPWNLETDRYAAWASMDRNAKAVWSWLIKGDGRGLAEELGLVLDPQKAPPTVYRDWQGNPTVEVHSVRNTLRRTARGGLATDIVIVVMQRRRGYFDKSRQEAQDGDRNRVAKTDEDGDFKFRAGCTIVLDPNTQTLRRIIRSRHTIADDAALDRVRRYLSGETSGIGDAFAAGRPASAATGAPRYRNEPFALLHGYDEG